MCHGTLVSHYVRQHGTQSQHLPQHPVLKWHLARKLLLHLASYLVGRFCVVWHASWILTLPVARLVGIANCLSGHGGLENWFSMRKREHFHLCLSAIRLLISTGGYPIGFIRLMRFTAWTFGLCADRYFVYVVLNIIFSFKCETAMALGHSVTQ